MFDQIATFFIVLAGTFGVPTVLWLAKTIWSASHVIERTALLQQQHKTRLEVLESRQGRLHTDFEVHRSQSATVGHSPR